MPYLDMNVFADWRVRHELVVILVGLINIILIAMTWCTGTDELYLSAVCVCVIVSLNCVLLQLLSCIQNNWHTVKFCQMVFHWLAAGALLFQSVTFLTTTFGIMNGIYCGRSLYTVHVTFRFIATSFGLVSSFIYGALALSATECSVNDRSGHITCVV